MLSERLSFAALSIDLALKSRSGWQYRSIFQNRFRPVRIAIPEERIICISLSVRKSSTLGRSTVIL
ncbi:MAG: hypothetical protein ACTTKX_09165 [Treponema sp.]